MLKKDVTKYDVIVVGGGHAGSEAAHAAAKMGAKTLLMTITLETIGRMSCNPTIGGPAKGHITREIDALGGLQALITDLSGIQFRMLNRKKGPAVWAPRSQNDRLLYSALMKEYLEKTDNLDIIEEKAVDVIIDPHHKKVRGVRTLLGEEIFAPCVILANGTFLRGLVHIGKTSFKAGRAGEPSCEEISESLLCQGIKLGRFKTGTPPRIDLKTVDLSKTTVQPGDQPPVGFSFFRNIQLKNKVSCYLTHTTEETHKIIRENISKSSLYSGQIKGTGPRYCPSVEDKIVRFADKPQHHIFIEPEGLNTFEAYVNGISNSLPPDIQQEMVHSIPGLEKAKIMRYGYAIEYDYVIPEQVKLSLESKKIEGLFFVGQINGTSGYEEAAAQGLIAGINAVYKLDKRDPFVLDRSKSYIGVLIDDLITKGTNEPYRMFTSRAEYRLHLRQDNADERLMELGYKIGLVSDKRWRLFLSEQEKIEGVLEFLKNNNGYNKNLREPVKLYSILKRGDVQFEDLVNYGYRLDYNLNESIQNKVTLKVKYEGYLKRQMADIEKFEMMENDKLPKDLDYMEINTVSFEAREKLNRVKPDSIGQASRISGVNFSDITAILVYLKKNKLGQISN